jgi:hypothetical protein
MSMRLAISACQWPGRAGSTPGQTTGTRHRPRSAGCRLVRLKTSGMLNAYLTLLLSHDYSGDGFCHRHTFSSRRGVL